MATDHALRTWRKENGRTLKALADEVGGTASHLSMIETGKKGASLELAAKLSRATGVPLDAFAPQMEAAQ